MDKIQKKLVGEAGSDVSAGFDEKRLTSDGKEVFSDLRGESLGSIKTFIFWNSVQFYCVMNPFPKIAIIGEYGTGKFFISLYFPSSYPSICVYHHLHFFLSIFIICPSNQLFMFIYLFNFEMQLKFHTL